MKELWETISLSFKKCIRMKNSLLIFSCAPKKCILKNVIWNKIWFKNVFIMTDIYEQKLKPDFAKNQLSIYLDEKELNVDLFV